MKKSLLYLFSCLTLIIGLAGCSDDDNPLVAPTSVSIDMGDKTKIMLGETIELKAVLGNETEAGYSWNINGTNVSTLPVYAFTPEQVGNYTILLKAENESGAVTAQASVEVVLLTVSIDAGGKNVLEPKGTLVLKAVTGEMSNLQYSWTVNGEEKATTKEFTFKAPEEEGGTFKIELTVSNKEGNVKETATLTIDVLKVITSTDDITCWTGTGENQSYLTIQWITGDKKDWDNPKKDDVHAYTWGYRWKADSDVTSYQMLVDIAKADPRFFMMEGPGFMTIGNGKAIWGFGFDGNGDGKFSIKNAGTGMVLEAKDFTDGLYTFPKNSSSSSEDKRSDGFVAVDEGDLWISGWTENYCSFWLGNIEGKEVPSYFNYSGSMADLNGLSNGSWDAWTFSSINDYYINTEVYPQYFKAVNPIPNK